MGGTMPAVIISYAPGGGGNHFKNMLCLDPMFVNSKDLDVAVYSEQTQPPGTVHSPPGRNVHETFLQGILTDTEKCYIIHGHFGELAPYRDIINQIPDKKFLILGIDNELDQQLLDRRQNRLGHKQHSYYIKEEQPLLYRPAMYTSYFSGKTQEDVCVIPLYEAWHPDLSTHDIVGRINRFLNTNIDQSHAQHLHDLWWRLNFNFDFCDFTRKLYGKTDF
jgi:hypothetical protein